MTLDIFENDMVLRLGGHLMFDFLIDNRIIGIVGFRHDKFVERCRPQRNDQGSDKNRHGQADKILSS